MKKQNESPTMWREYRRIKLRLIILALGWMPFGFLLLEVSTLNRQLEPITLLMFPYFVYTMFILMRFQSYRCPNCGVSLFVGRFFRRTCKGCGIQINKEVPPIPKTTLSS
jgi:hypothetical protein